MPRGGFAGPDSVFELYVWFGGALSLVMEDSIGVRILYLSLTHSQVCTLSRSRLRHTNTQTTVTVHQGISVLSMALMNFADVLSRVAFSICFKASAPLQRV